MKQIKFVDPNRQQFLVTIFSDDTVEVETRSSVDDLWSPIRGDQVEIIDTKESNDVQ